jgi:hypothetical protein
MFLKFWEKAAMLCIVAFSPFLCRAAAQAVDDHNAHVWLMYFGDHPVTSRWSVHLEGQMRRSDLGLGWQQLLLRPGVNYQFNRYVSGTVGYGFANSYPYGDFPSRATLPEHRFFEQIWIKHPLKAIGLQHRFRVEQRLMRTLGSAPLNQKQWEFRQRFRYMFRSDIPLVRDKRFYLGLYDEFFINFGGNRGIRYLDQNRAYGAFGTKLSRFEKLEVGYLHQYVPQRNGRVLEHNHTLQIALFSSRPFGQGSEKK